MSPWFKLAAILAFLSACTETPVSLPLRSLERSGEVSFVCAAQDDQGRGEGYDINSCPDFDSTENPRHLYALVTQTLRGEVAVIDLSAGSVVDMDRSTPGYNFLPIGQNPSDIVSTPGGQVSFVGVGASGKEGIFVLPTSCARPPAHDLTAWPACSLPSRPGEMAVVVDPPGADDGDPTTPLPVRASCDSAYSTDAATVGTAIAAGRDDCPVDLAKETSPPGRRKLLVEMPELGGIAVFDAQALADREPGSYQPCEQDLERWIPLDTSLPAGDIKQQVPPDLQSSCIPQEINYGPKPGVFLSRPAGIDVSEGRLFVSDQGAPLVHVLDISDPCSPTEQPPLLPVAFEAQNRTVTTRQVAVSPKTSKGQQFAYAIDDYDGSVMVFDATPGASDRTPIVRPGSPLLPFEPADRIAFSSPARDITFALRDSPAVDPDTGVAAVGTFCDPTPGASGPATKYRTSSGYTGGAGPRNLRGVFGFVALSTGQVAVVDVEDWDAPCRRPITTNPEAIEDFHGCASDPGNISFFTEDGTQDGSRTVSGEESCRVVEQHRARSGTYVITSGDTGARAPSLRSFPRLSAPEGGNLPTDQTTEGLQNPKVLAVDYASPTGGSTPAEVFVSTTRYRHGAESGGQLETDPSVADRASIALMQREPRAFADEEFTLQYEGVLADERPAGFLDITPVGQDNVLKDGDGNFCNRGVEDEDLAREVGQGLGLDGSKLNTFALKHADYVQLTSPLRGKDDSYWSSGAGASCGGQTGKAAYFACRDAFGTTDTPSELRDLRIVQAYQDHLIVEPRSAGDAQAVLDQMYCCFGGSALRYKLRGGAQWVLRGSASGFRHNVTADADLRCIRDCSPRRSLLRGRALEISSSSCAKPANDEPGECAVGPATPDDVACVLSGQSGAPATGDGSACVFQNVNYRFAVYRGNQPSERDMTFSWQTAGGFAPLTANLAAQSAAVSPQSMRFVPQIGQIAVVDGAAEGLVLVSLDSVGVSRLYF